MLYVSSSEDDKVKSCVYFDFFEGDCLIDDTDDEESEDAVGFLLGICFETEDVCWLDICFLFMSDGDEDISPGCTGDETGIVS